MVLIATKVILFCIFCRKLPFVYEAYVLNWDCVTVVFCIQLGICGKNRVDLDGSEMLPTKLLLAE